MNVTLKPKVRDFVQDKVRSGQYASPEDVIEAGLAALRQQEAFGDFEPGELDQLIEQGEVSSKHERPSAADDVLAEFRRTGEGALGGALRARRAASPPAPARGVASPPPATTSPWATYRQQPGSLMRARLP